jgi:hypothetical protein
MDKELVDLIKAEIAHNITPVIGWLRRDAQTGRVDDDQDRLNEYRRRLQKAAEDVAVAVENRK